MKVFICWSGRRGKEAAHVMTAWLSGVFAGAVEARASVGMEKGIPWRDELADFLNEATIGLLCLTPEALQSPWVNFEAGVLSKAINAVTSCPVGPKGNRGRLFTFLWGVPAWQLTGPLAAFQSTDANDERDVRRMVENLATLLPADAHSVETGRALGDDWSEHWQDLCNGLAMIPRATLPEVCPEFPDLFRRHTFEEPTADCVDQQWLHRYAGAHDTFTAVVERRQAVEAACSRYVIELFRNLEIALKGYAMALSLLVRSDRFALSDGGTVEIVPPGLVATCEERRHRIRQLVAQLVDPSQAPFFDEAVQFSNAEEFAERKSLIHRLTPAVIDLARSVHQANLELPKEWPANAFCFTMVRLALELASKPSTQEVPRSSTADAVNVEQRWRGSSWDLDRIMYAVFVQERLKLDPSNVLGLIAYELALTEFEKARSSQTRKSSAGPLAPRVKHASVAPLYYALDAVASSDLGRLPDSSRLQSLLDDVVAFLDERDTVDQPVRSMVARIRRQLSSSHPPERDGRLSAGPPATVKAVTSGTRTT